MSADRPTLRRLVKSGFYRSFVLTWQALKFLVIRDISAFIPAWHWPVCDKCDRKLRQRRWSSPCQRKRAYRGV